MKITMCAQARFYLQMPPDVLDIIIKLAEHHYDGLCKSAAMDLRKSGGALGHLLVWRNSLSGFPESPVRADSDRLQTTLKICEAYPYLPGQSEEQKAKVHTIIGQMHRALIEADDLIGAFGEKVLSE